MCVRFINEWIKILTANWLHSKSNPNSLSYQEVPLCTRANLWSSGRQALLRHSWDPSTYPPNQESSYLSLCFHSRQPTPCRALARPSMPSCATPQCLLLLGPHAFQSPVLLNQWSIQAQGASEGHGIIFLILEKYLLFMRIWELVGKHMWWKYLYNIFFLRPRSLSL